MKSEGRQVRVNALVHVALTLPLATLACGGEPFSAGPEDGGEPEGGIVFGDGGSGHDAATRDSGRDSRADAQRDAPEQPDAQHDGSHAPDGETPESGTDAAVVETGGGCTGAEILCNGTTCVDTANDPQNCNGCNNVCPPGPLNSQPTCVSGSCGWTCNPSYEQCGSTCLLDVPDSVHGVFVAQGGSPASCGTMSNPCSTVTAGLEVAAGSNGSKTIVYVAQSTTPYAETVGYDGVVTIEGGWVYANGQWSRPCALDPTQTVIEASGAYAYALLAQGTGTQVAVDTLKLVAPDVTHGATSYGAVASGGQLTMTNVVVQVGNGGAGDDGTQGTAGTAPPGTCNAADGANGAAGAAGVGAPPGRYQGAPGAYLPSAGGIGNLGGAGDNGTAAPLAGTLGGPQCTDVYPGTQTTNGNCCNIGSGDGQGCLACGGSPNTQICASVGTPGCGSTGSSGGRGGNGGGASLGVFANGNATVVLQDVSITTGAGGNGGNGGLGGSVVPGSAGTTGASRQYVSSCSTHCDSQAMTCMCNPTVSGTLLGSTGGKGGTGGLGGQGGGGSGGDSFCYASDGTATFDVTGLACTPGSAGLGGNNGLPGAGAAGHSGIHN